MRVTLYRIPQLRANKQNTLSFSNVGDRSLFFDAVAQQLTISNLSDSTVGRITDIGKLYQQLTVFTNGRNPYSQYNYVKITSAGKDYFYFVTDFREIGNSQVIYSLKKDTIVTYVSTSGGDVDLTQHKALVIREHKPRFNYANNRVLYHRIPEPGDTSTPLLKSTVTVNGSRRARLVYKNRTDSKPVAYPYVETATSVNVQGADWIGVIYSSIEGTATPDEPCYAWDGNFQYTTSEGTPNITITVPSNRYVVYERTGFGQRKLTSRLKSTGLSPITILNVPSGVDLKIKVSTTDVQLLTVSSTHIPLETPWTTVLANSDTINYSPTSTKNLPLWSEIDQYDAATDRIVEIPYFNTVLPKFYEDGYGIFIPLETSLSETQQVDILTPFVYNMTKDDIDHVVGNDPKLYTSQFAPIMINMNGMTQGIKREMLNNTAGVPATIQAQLSFRTEALFPSTFNNKVNIVSYDYDKEDADELLATYDVNNEVASIKDEAYTYNQYYKDLDDKQRRIQESAAVRNTWLNSVNQALGVVGGMIAGGTPNKAQIAARTGQAAINIAQSFMDLQDQMKLNAIQAKQKYIGMLLSSTQIAGAPLQFVKSFNGDRWRIMYFGLKDLDLAYWDEVFHKFGYTTLEYKIPQLKTRRYWDYKQMIIDEVSSAFVTDECIDDIKERFAEGVTIFHYHTYINPATIDWDQTKENWEI